jgi:hypothetical protein
MSPPIPTPTAENAQERSKTPAPQSSVGSTASTRQTSCIHAANGHSAARGVPGATHRAVFRPFEPVATPANLKLP